jgi:hypothetical protein
MKEGKMTLLLLALCLALLGAAIYWTPLPWRDDGDVRGLVLHTLRIPSALERHAIWRDRNFLREDAGEPIWPSKIVLPESQILKGSRHG